MYFNYWLDRNETGSGTDWRTGSASAAAKRIRMSRKIEGRGERIFELQTLEWQTKLSEFRVDQILYPHGKSPEKLYHADIRHEITTLRI